MGYRGVGKRFARMLAAIACLALLAAGCARGAQGPATRPEAGSPTGSRAGLRVAMILPGTVEDADFNFVGYKALERIKQELEAETAYQERVPPAEAERVARGFITDGYSVIAFHGGQYVTVVKKLAPQFPEVTFIMESSGPQDVPANVWNIGRRFYEGFYALGALGALATRSGKVGVIAGVKLPDFVASINAIRQAASQYNPKAQIVYTFVGDQNDPVKARQAAEAQLADGVDFIILMVNLGAQGVIEAVRGKPVLLTTYYTDKTALAPENFAASLLTDFGAPYLNVLRKIEAGTRTGYEEMRPGNGFDLSEIRNVAPDVAAQVKEIFAKVVRREIQVLEVLKLEQ